MKSKIDNKEVNILFDESIDETFNDMFEKCDETGKTNMRNILLYKSVKCFYKAVGFKFIGKYLTKLTEA